MKNNLLTNIQQKIKFIIFITLICFIFLLFFPGKVWASAGAIGGGGGSHDCGPNEKCVAGHSVWVDDPVIPGWDYICTKCGPIKECCYKHCTSSGSCRESCGTSAYICGHSDDCQHASDCRDDDEVGGTTTTTPSTCFLAGTSVSMSDGTEKPIEDIKVGDVVLSYDEKSKSNVASIVKKTLHHPKEQTNSYLIINNKLRVTPNHPTLVNNKWQRIDNANIGKVLRLQNGNNLIITSIRIVYDKVPTYNLEVEDTHTYYAGGVLVHNGCGTDKDPPTTTTTPTTTPTTVYTTTPATVYTPTTVYTPPTTTVYTTIYTTSTTTDPCAGVNCGSCRYCSGGSCYNYCSGTSSSCGCTSCTNCGSCAYCSGTSCISYCSGTDTSCGCTSCTNCNTLDNWYNKGSTYPCCDLTDPDTICTCQDQEYRNYYCSGTSCTYSITNTQTLRSGCNNCGYCKTCSSGSCIDKPGVKGTVTDAFENPIEDAEIKILGLDKSITTDANGNYFICEFPQGIYDIVASKKGFDPVNKQFDFDGIEVVPVNFILYTAGSDCRPDCSKTNDEIPVCHMDCEGINGCRFYDDTLMNICTRKGEMIGVPVGNTVSYNETYKARCCEGSPYLYKKTPGTSLVFPEAENIVRITRIVFFRGQFARMIIDVFK